MAPKFPCKSVISSQEHKVFQKPFDPDTGQQSAIFRSASAIECSESSRVCVSLASVLLCFCGEKIYRWSAGNGGYFGWRKHTGPLAPLGACFGHPTQNACTVGPGVLAAPFLFETRGLLPQLVPKAPLYLDLRFILEPNLHMLGPKPEKLSQCKDLSTEPLPKRIFLTLLCFFLDFLAVLCALSFGFTIFLSSPDKGFWASKRNIFALGVLYFALLKQQERRVRVLRSLQWNPRVSLRSP